MPRSLYTIFLFICGFSLSGNAQIVTKDTLETNREGYVWVSEINIVGNQRTKSKVILRELVVEVGDTIPLQLLDQVLYQNELQVLNTGLFTNAWLTAPDELLPGTAIPLTVTLYEAWYIFPIPIFELGDRNFNIWWTEQNRALDRINFGIHYLHNNPLGYRDQLKAVIQYGYTQKYELDYNFPNINRNAALALNLNVLSSSNREIPYNTVDNRWVFYRDEDNTQFRRFRFRTGISFRPRIRSSHGLSAAYHRDEISTFAYQELNEKYFNNRRSQQYFSVAYSFLTDHRDIRPYPMHGYLLHASLRKNGVGLIDDLNALDLSLTGEYYAKLTNRQSLSFRARAKTALMERNNQPYYNSRAFGFGRDFIRGYELYVIDGIDYAYLKSSWHFRVFDRVLNLGKLMPIQSMRQFPVKVFATINNDFGIANNPRFSDQNTFANRLLWGTGVGLNFVLLYDKVIRVEYSRNHLNEKGVFLSFQFNFIPRE